MRVLIRTDRFIGIEGDTGEMVSCGVPDAAFASEFDAENLISSCSLQLLASSAVRRSSCRIIAGNCDGDSLVRRSDPSRNGRSNHFAKIQVQFCIVPRYMYLVQLMYCTAVLGRSVILDSMIIWTLWGGS